MTPEQRFHAKYDQAASGCWLWRAATDTPGYGRFQWNGRLEGAHRVAWEIAFGPIPDGKYVLHRCNTKKCVNPAHLYLGDASINAKDALRDGLLVIPDRAGENNGNARLTKYEVTAIRSAYSRGGVSQQSLASRFGVQQAAISKIVRGLAWSGV